MAYGNLGNFNVTKSGLRSGGFFGRKKNILWLELDTFETGKSAIPKTAVKYRRKPDKGWKEIEITNNKDGKPVVKLTGQAMRTMRQRKVSDIIISLSHAKNYAVANAILISG